MSSEVKSLSIVRLLQEQYGIKPQFEPDLAQVPSRVNNNSYGTAYYTTDDLGREVFLPITFSYSDEQGIIQEVVLYHAVMEISGPNNDIDTPLTERGGTFTELISAAPWMIDIKGFLINGPNDFPEEKFKQLITLKRLRSGIAIKNAISDLVLKTTENGGTANVVVKDVRFPSTVGVQNVKAFTMQLKEDSSFNLEEIE